MELLRPPASPQPQVLGVGVVVGHRHPPPGPLCSVLPKRLQVRTKHCELNASSLGVGVCVWRKETGCVLGGDDITGRAPSNLPCVWGNPGYLPP